MSSANRWQLPDGVDEILPPQASKLERLRRELLDLYASWGYELVFTPLIEFLESLNIIPGDELQLETFQIVDQLSGRGMGVRADITTQVARIDAHVLQTDNPQRLCYADTILRTRPSSMLGSRSPFRIGAELYGHSGLASDVEVVSLMLETLAICGINDVQLALGHTDIYRSLISQLDLTDVQEKNIFHAIQRKAPHEIASLLEEAELNGSIGAMLKALPELSGSAEILDEAESLLAEAPEAALQALQQLREIHDRLARLYPQQSLYFDLSELRGYEYHTGIVFAAYVEEFGQSIAKGGRYDGIGTEFGRSRAATGFDADLKILLNLSKRNLNSVEKVFAPAGDDSALLDAIIKLRSEGKQVIRCLEGQQANGRDLDCRSELTLVDGQWQLTALN